MRTVNDILALLSGRLRKEKLRGVVLSPGEDTLAALEKAAALLPVKFTVYAGPAALPGIESRLGTACYEFAQTKDTVLELSQHLLGECGPCDFVVRGDLLPLDDAYRAISCVTSAESAPGAGSPVPPGATQRPSYAKPRAERPFLSHVALFDASALARVLVISDGFVNPRPDVRTRIEIIRNCLGVCRAIGIQRPRVAILAAVEQVYPGMPVTVESAEISKMCKAGELESAYVDGPLSFDVALDEEVAKDKGASGEVAGNADVLIGSSTEVVNGIYMAQTVLGRADAASVVVGGKKPLALPFPSDCVDNIFFSICLACLLSGRDVRS